VLPETHQTQLIAQIHDQLEIRNSLIGCTDLDELAGAGLSLISEKLKPQTAALFLFDKGGNLRRVGIRGIDKKGRAISGAWYADESYQPGESFTGKAIYPVGDSQFGEPQWTNNLKTGSVDPKSAKAYTNLLGFLRCAMCVPLNGRHKTYGALEVINKLDSAGRPSRKCEFRPDDLYWLSVVGMSTASAITSLRRQAELDHLADVSTRQQEPFGKRFDAGREYTSMAERLVSAESPYSACLVRVVNETGKLKVVGRATDGIPWDGAAAIGSCTDLREGLAGKACRSAELIDYEDIEGHAGEFRHARWVRRSGLRSYACVPLKIQDRVVGTLSLFTRYRHRLYDTDKTFLRHIAAQIASVAESARKVDELRETAAAVSVDAEKGKLDALAAGYWAAIASHVHKYKSDLQCFKTGFESTVNASAAERASIANKHIRLIRLLLSEIESDTAPARTRVNINQLVRHILRFQEMVPTNAGIKFEKRLDHGLPALDARKADLRTVIGNLVSNSIRAVLKAGRTNGLVTVTTARMLVKDIERLELCVSDNGIGIPLEVRDKMYSSGFTTYPGGDGQGLYLTEQIVNNTFGGSIECISTVGRGTTFKIRIPLLRNQWKGERT
jgi:signal transduction histidine kinase